MLDALLALALACALVGVRALEAHGLQRAGWLGYALAVLASLLLAGRRRWPLAVFAGTLAFALISITFASPTGAISVPVVISIYTLAQVNSKRSAVLLSTRPKRYRRSSRRAKTHCASCAVFSGSCAKPTSLSHASPRRGSASSSA